MERYVTNKFTGIRRSTIGTDFRSKKIAINEIDVILQIWDTAGQERFFQGSSSVLPSSFYRGSHGALLVYDVNNEKSFEQILMWHSEIMSRVGTDDYFPLVVIGNKIDVRENLDESVRVNHGELLDWCRDHSYGHVETSAKEGVGVQAAMQVIAGLALDAYRQREEIDVNRSARTKSKISVSDLYTENKSGVCSC